MKGPFGPFFRFPMFVLFLTIARCRAQTNRIFKWQFTNNNDATSLSACEALPITVGPYDLSRNVSGVPPYYMLAFAVDGTPTTSLIGTGQGDLRWTVNQPVGTRVLLNVVDSTGSSGGVPSSLYTITAGETTRCLPPQSTAAEFTVTANVTDELSTCHPWALTIQGGTSPYKVVLTSLDSSAVTNVTMPAGDNLYTYINRANPGGALLAAISDASGIWANRSLLVRTVGSAPKDCPSGLSSTSGKTNNFPNPLGKKGDTSGSKVNTSVIIGVCVAMGALLLVGILLGILFLRRRRARKELEGMDLLARQFNEGDQQLTTIASAASPGASIQRSKINHTALSSPPLTQFTASTPYDPYEGSGGGNSLSVSSGSARPSLSSRSPSSPGFLSKAPEAGVPDAETTPNLNLTQSQTRTRDRSAASSDIPSAQALDSRWPPGGPSRYIAVGIPDTAMPGEVIFQHRDAGAARPVVRELPPPYAPRSRPPTP